MRTTRLITVLAVSAGLVVAAPVAAAAQEPVTVTLSPEQVQRVCEQRIPRIERRVRLPRLAVGTEDAPPGGRDAEPVDTGGHPRHVLPVLLQQVDDVRLGDGRVRGAHREDEEQRRRRRGERAGAGPGPHRQSWAPVTRASSFAI